MRRKKQRIREYVKTALENKTDAGSNVVISRAIPTWSENLPQINIYSDSEPVAVHHQSPKTYKREYQFNVECSVAVGHGEDVDDFLDTMTEQVEQALEYDDSFNQLVDFCDLANVNYSGEPDGDALKGTAILTYQVVYLEEAIDPDAVEYKDFKGIDLKIDLNKDKDPDGEPVIDAEDTINLDT